MNLYHSVNTPVCAQAPSPWALKHSKGSFIDMVSIESIFSAARIDFLRKLVCQRPRRKRSRNLYPVRIVSWPFLPDGISIDASRMAPMGCGPAPFNRRNETSPRCSKLSADSPQNEKQSSILHFSGTTVTANIATFWQTALPANLAVPHTCRIRRVVMHFLLSLFSCRCISKRADVVGQALIVQFLPSSSNVHPHRTA